MEGPVRTCLVCRTRRRKPELLRLVAVHGTVVPDPQARRTGRGAYVCVDAGCGEALLARGPAALSRPLRTGATTVRVEAEDVRSVLEEKRREAKMTAEGALRRVPPAA